MGQTIQELQSRPNAPEIVYLDSELSSEEMIGLYTACDCLVHPYRGEGIWVACAGSHGVWVAGYLYRWWGD